MSELTGHGSSGTEITVREVQAKFRNNAALQEAVSQLGLAGYDRTALSLPEDQPNKSGGSANEPTDDVDKQQLRTLTSGMAGTIGAFALAGATVVTGGAAGIIALGAAAVAGTGISAASSAIGTSIEDASDMKGVAERDQRGTEGWLLLAVRTRGESQIEQVTGIVRAAGATEVVPVTEANEALTAGISSASWTGS